MKVLGAWLVMVGILGLPVPAQAGESLWTPGGPTLVLSLGDGTIRKALDLPSGAMGLHLVLKKFLLDDERVQIVWKADGALWTREVKKIPGDESTEWVNLPPGRLITLEISTLLGTPVASIKLRRN